MAFEYGRRPLPKTMCDALHESVLFFVRSGNRGNRFYQMDAPMIEPMISSSCQLESIFTFWYFRELVQDLAGVDLQSS